jgi:RND family efflux transporter MFP subunit
MSSEEKENTPTLTRPGRIALVAVLILFVGIAIKTTAEKFGKTATEAEVKRPVPDVELVTAKVENAPISLESQGIVQAVTETRAAAEVPGRIVWVSPSWDAGGTFKQGEELLKIDDADYKAVLANAEATAAEAALQVRMEEERGAQAKRDWAKLASGKPESDLVTRGPQMAAAKAHQAASVAAVEKAKRDLERTVLHAPYGGRIRTTLTDLGSYAAPASALADFYSTDAFQVSLPLSLEDYQLLEAGNKAPVQLSAGTGELATTFTGNIVRTAAEIDRASRTIQVIAEIKPDGKASPLLVPGLFVKASLPGRTLQNVVKLPRVCLFPDNRVAVVTPENKLTFKAVKVARSGKDDVLISEGLKSGDRVLATVLAVVTEGMEVNPVSGVSGSLTPTRTPTPTPEESRSKSESKSRNEGTSIPAGVNP